MVQIVFVYVFLEPVFALFVYNYVKGDEWSSSRVNSESLLLVEMREEERKRQRQYNTINTILFKQ